MIDITRNHMTSFELASILIGFFTVIIALLAFLQSSISKITTMSSADKANNLAELALKISLHEHKKKILPVLTASYAVSKLSIAHPDTYTISYLIKNRSLAKVKIVTIDVNGSCNTEPFLTETDLAFNQELFLDVSFKQEILEKLKKETIELGNKSGFDEAATETEFDRRVRIELNKSRIWITVRDELNNRYLIQLVVNYRYSGNRYAIADTFTGEPIEFPE